MSGAMEKPALRDLKVGLGHLHLSMQCSAGRKCPHAWRSEGRENAYMPSAAGQGVGSAQCSSVGEVPTCPVQPWGEMPMCPVQGGGVEHPCD